MAVHACREAHNENYILCVDYVGQLINKLE